MNSGVGPSEGLNKKQDLIPLDTAEDEYPVLDYDGIIAVYFQFARERAVSAEAEGSR